MTKNILVFGNPLLDISVTVPDTDIFERYGLKPGNAIMAEDKHMAIYDELMKSSPSFIAGGAAQNSVRAAQWMIGIDKPSTYYIGCIGNDATGDTLKEAAAKANVKALYKIDENAPTGCCGVIVHEKERSLVANLGASEKYTIDHFQGEEVQNILESIDIFYTTGFVLTHSADTAVAIGKCAKKDGKQFMINVAAPFVTQFFLNQLKEVLPYATIVCSNEDEAAAMAEGMGWDKEDLEGYAEKLAKYGSEDGSPVRTVIITQGAKETLVFQNGELSKHQVPQIDEEKIIDTNGAGDSFVGGFLAGLSLGVPLEKAVDAGHYCGGYCIQRSGAEYGDDKSYEW